ncbi:MAG: hypothetical protein ACPGSO_00725 [Vicingaceae bacterium]
MEINLKLLFSKVEYNEFCDNNKDGDNVVINIGGIYTQGIVKNIKDSYYLITKNNGE